MRNSEEKTQQITQNRFVPFDLKRQKLHLFIQY